MASEARADILLVTATKIETRSVLEALGVSGQQTNPQSINGRVYFDLGTINGARVRMTQCEMGPGGLGAAQQAVDKGIAALSPAAVVMVGIAFGVSEEKQSIGDVLVTEHLRPYELQRVGTQKDGRVMIVLRDDKPHASPWLLNLLKSSEVTWEGATLRFGTVLTGAKLVDNNDFREQLRAFEPEAIGGEMEGGGLYVACHDRKVDWILVKAICDFADGQKAKDKSERQALAAKNAAAFVYHALRFAEVDWQAHAPAGSQSAGRGGKGGNAKVGGSGIAVGGPGGGGGPPGAASGGDGGSAEVTGDGFALGGEGGEAGQLHRGGRGGRSPLEILGILNQQFLDGRRPPPGYQQACPDPSAIIAKLQSGDVPLSACIADALAFAAAVGDKDLKVLCERELVGYAGTGQPSERGGPSKIAQTEEVGHRVIQFYIALGAEVSIDYFGSAQRAIAWMQAQPKEFPPFKFVYPEPIATIERNSKQGTADKLVSIRMPASALVPNTNIPNEPVICYAPGDAFANLLERTRTLFTGKLLRYVAAGK